MPFTTATESTELPLLGPKVSRSAFALITVGHGDVRTYLLQWNAKWGVYNMIGGKVDNQKGDKNSFIHTLHRELEEEMGLQYPDDYVIDREFNPIFLSQYSQRQKIFKNYHFCVFVVNIFPHLPIDRNRMQSNARWLSTGRQNVFVSKQEIIQLQTHGNIPISRTTKLILQALGELCPYIC